MNVTRDNLNAVMEFDHVVRVDSDGTVTDAEADIYAPDVHDNLDGSVLVMSPHGSKPWALMNGYSGQDRYAGPVMHASEYIGGKMADDILATPGLYVSVMVYCNVEDVEDDEDDDVNVSGWAVAYITDDGTAPNS